MGDVVKEQELEIRVREWKDQYDHYGVKQYEADKLKAECDNTGSIIVGLMQQVGVDKFKTYYGTVELKGDNLVVSDHPATAKVEVKKRGPGRPKKSQDVSP